MAEDRSSGYEAVAQQFMAARSDSGRALVSRWAADLPAGACVLDVGAGVGTPLTSALVSAGLRVWAIDAAPTLVAAFRQRLPTVPIACEAAEDSAFFGRRFDAIMAVGLLFLLPEDRQTHLLQRLSAVLEPGGRLLFSAPYQRASWTDVLTGRTARSLGSAGYRSLLAPCGLKIIGTATDEGGSNYFEAQKPV